MDALEAVLEKERSDGRAKDARHKLTVDRLRKQLVEMQVGFRVQLFFFLWNQARWAGICHFRYQILEFPRNMSLVSWWRCRWVSG